MDSAQNQSGRLEAYRQFRPGYPIESAQVLRRTLGLKPGAAVADINSGSGIFTRMLLMEGLRVIGVEPDPGLRASAAQYLVEFPLFQSWDGRAEDTGLPDNTVEAITVSHALYNCNWEQLQREFRRIVKPGGWLLLVWNERRPSEDNFQIAYDNLLQEFGVNYTPQTQRGPDRKELIELFGHRGFKSRFFKNRQHLNWEQIKGRLLSSPHVPMPGNPDCPPMLRRLQQLFETLATDQQVMLEYQTHLHFGHIV